MDSVVLFLIDDTPDNVPPYIAQAVDLASDGVTFVNHTISTPLCSPSRASTMTGWHAHNTGVTANDWPRGGYGVYHDLEPDAIFPVMQALGYLTALIGKYQNHYLPAGNADSSKGATYPALHVPDGADYFFGVDAGGYAMFDYTATLKTPAGAATLVSTTGGTKAEADYMTDVVSTHAQAAVAAADTAGKPLFMIVCPFATHSGGAGSDPEHYKFVVAPRHRKDGPSRPGIWGAMNFPVGGDCGDPVDGGCLAITTASRPGDLSYNAIVENPTAWHRTSPFSDAELDVFTGSHILQIQQGQAISEMIEDVRAQLVTSGLDSTTWLMLQSDNGLHLGEHCAEGQKSTPFDHDTMTTFIIRPPGGTTGRDETAVVQNVDLFNTWLDIAGEPEDATRDGHSLVPYVTGTPPDPPDQRKTALIVCDTDNGTWEDAQGTGLAPPQRTLRDVNWLYADFNDPGTEGAPPTGRGELYRMTAAGPVPADPWQTVNQYPYLTQGSRDDLDEMLKAMLAASGTALFDLQKQPIPALVFGEIIDDTTECHVLLDGVEFHKPDGKYEMHWSTDHPVRADKKAPLTKIEGIPGLQLSGKGDSVESNWVLVMRIYDRLTTGGNHGGWSTCYENLQDILLMIETDQIITVGWSRGGPVRFEFKARVIGEIKPVELEEYWPTLEITIPFQIPQGARRALSNEVWSRALDVDLDNAEILLPYTTKAIVDGMVRLVGPFTKVQVEDKISNGSGFIFQHPDEKETPGTRDIADDEYVLVEVETHKAWLATYLPDQELSWDHTGMTDVSAGLDSYGPGRVLYPITPKAGGGGPGVGPDPRNRLAKVDVVVTYAGVRSPTAIDIRYKQARP